MTEFEVQVLTELSRIREILERREAGETSPLRAIHSATRGATFTVNELVQHAAVPANFDLRAALEREFDDPNSHRIGKWLAAIAGRQLGDFIVENVGRERHAVLWRVGVCPSKLTSPVARAADAVMLTARIGRK